MRRAGLVVPAILVMATMSACAADSPNEVPPAPSSSSVSPVIPDLDPSQLNPATPGVVDDITGETYTPQPVPEWDANSRKSVVAAAEAAMRAFARPDLDFEKWWADVQPLLDQKASLDYSYMEPASIPANEITGAGVIVDDTSAFVGTVEVPTNAGTYTVILSRADADGPWLTSRFIPPEAVR